MDAVQPTTVAIILVSYTVIQKLVDVVASLVKAKVGKNGDSTSPAVLVDVVKRLDALSEHTVDLARQLQSWRENEEKFLDRHLQLLGGVSQSVSDLRLDIERGFGGLREHQIKLISEVQAAMAKSDSERAAS